MPNMRKFLSEILAIDWDNQGYLTYYGQVCVHTLEVT